jgi:lysozyme
MGAVIDPSWARGIDVNHFHPVVDWDALPPGLAMFAAKATDDSRQLGFVDPTLAAHRDGARARGFDLVTYYHVAGPGDGAEAVQRVLAAVGKLAPNEGIALDIERGPASEITIDYVEAFYAELERQGACTGHDLGYWSAGVWALMGNPQWARASQVGLWAPRYKSAGQEPKLPPPWGAWTVWQWTDGGQTGDPYYCPGVGPCDASYFNGPRDALRAFVARPPF